MEEKRDLRIEKTYLALNNAFIKLLEEKKFENITVNELCEKAMIRRATFYKHFADKYEYYTFFVREQKKKFEAESLHLRQTKGPYEYYLSVTRSIIRFLGRHDKMVEKFFESSILPQLLGIVADEIVSTMSTKLHEDIQRGYSLPVAPEILASFYTGGLIQTVRLWLVQKDKISEDDLIAQIEKIFKAFQPAISYYDPLMSDI